MSSREASALRHCHEGVIQITWSKMIHGSWTDPVYFRTGLLCCCVLL